MTLSRGFVAMAAVAVMTLFALSSLTHARAGPGKDKAVIHQATMVTAAGEIAVQPSTLVTRANYAISQSEVMLRAGLSRARSPQTYDGRSPTISEGQRQPPAVVQIE